MSVSSLAAEPEVPITLASSALASCSEDTPTPEDAPFTSTHSPAFSRPCSTSMSKVTRNTSGIDAASSHDKLAGTGIASPTSTSAYSEKPPAQRPITRSPSRQPVTPCPSAATSPAASPPMAFHDPALPCRPCPTTNSPRLSDAARTRTSNCPGPGSGMGTSRNSSCVAVSLISIQYDCMASPWVSLAKRPS